jgi:AmmeMemoRadiSam system protein A
MNNIYLPQGSQKKLMELSRRTLVAFVRRIERRSEAVEDPYLRSHEYGAFVSLHKKKELRGCIGNCAPQAPLYETVIEMTEAAASRDHRVEPISADELDDIRIDITVLSPLVKANDPLSLEVGKHGLHIARGPRRGVLLPQVATQYRWDMKTFLEQTCVKAGLPENAWQEADTDISAFTALVMEESL